MGPLWMGVTPGPLVTRVLVTNGAGRTLLTACLPHGPRHPRSIPTLCEALALWCGRPVHAALAVVGPDAFCATREWLETFDALTRSPLYEIELVETASPPRRGAGAPDDVEGE